MKKLIYLLFLSLFVFTSCEQEDEIIDQTSIEGKSNLVKICRYNPGIGIWETVSVPEKSLKGQLNNPNTYLGPCKTFIPDDTFENALIYWGLDDVMDNYVLTSNIVNIESLVFGEVGYSVPFGIIPYTEVTDFTGIEDFAALKNFQIYFGHDGSNLDLSKNIALENLTFHEAIIINLDLSKNLNIISLDIISSKTLEKLNINNGNNISITNFVVWGNSKLTCIQVDNPIDANNGIAPYDTWSTDATGIYFENCGF